MCTGFVINKGLDTLTVWLMENLSRLESVSLKFGGGMIGTDVNGSNMDGVYQKMKSRVIKAAESLNPKIVEQKPYVHG